MLYWWIQIDMLMLTSSSSQKSNETNKVSTFPDLYDWLFLRMSLTVAGEWVDGWEDEWGSGVASWWLVHENHG